MSFRNGNVASVCVCVCMLFEKGNWINCTIHIEYERKVKRGMQASMCMVFSHISHKNLLTSHNCVFIDRASIVEVDIVSTVQFSPSWLYYVTLLLLHMTKYVYALSLLHKYHRFLAAKSTLVHTYFRWGDGTIKSICEYVYPFQAYILYR